MSWTTKQCEQILEHAWHDSAVCPVDQTTLQVRLAEMMSGDYRLEATCPKCGRHITLGREKDPRRSAFRLWTAEEIGAMVDATLQGKVPKCPVCSAGIHVKENSLATGTTITLQCPRCGCHEEREIARGR